LRNTWNIGIHNKILK